MRSSQDLRPGPIGPSGPSDLDAAASTPLHPAARETLLAALDHGWADPRRLHKQARDARILLDNAREVVAAELGLRRDDVTFTSSGTDAVHRGLLGLRLARSRVGRHALATAVEHAAVLHALTWAEGLDGGAHDLVGVDRQGRVSPQAVREALSPATAVVAVQAANHEVGTVQPITAVADAIGEVPLFVDACAAVGHIDLPDGWAAAAASAHKWGGPAGVGLLLVRPGTRWRTPFPADDRVDPRASGFENVAAALAAAAALRAVLAERAEVAARQRRLIDRIRAAAAAIEDVDVVGDPDDRLPHVVTFSCLYLDGEALVTALDRRGFGVASGSACTASTLEPSHVLAAMGALTHGNVRLSLHRDTGEDVVEAFCRALPEVVAELRA